MKRKYKVLLLILLFVAVLFVSNNVFAKECVSGTREYVSCGSDTNKVTGIPKIIPQVTSFMVALLKIFVPIVLIISGMVEMMKSIAAGTAENVAKSKNKLIKKFVAALIAFFVVTFITTIVKLIADGNEKATFVSCMSCYLNNDCDNECTSYVSEDGKAKNRCEEFSVDQCLDANNSGLTCVVANSKCVTAESECKSYTQDACNDAYDSHGNKCHQVYSSGSGGMICAPENPDSCSRFKTKETCKGQYDSSNRLCVYSSLYGCQTAYESCSSYDPRVCEEVTDSNGNACKLGEYGTSCIQG